ncbi:preprotein translocase subunit SecG [Aureimonas psammosilenae]|uniref:preprotein translocase subunit SecG n=1 Tax=Aureimonas psammosilenae TaxID=2495496 RepID=UPI001260FB06|nr:preprotein translocase subunit SecG [Aureimonas psammosilenae]
MGSILDTILIIVHLMIVLALIVVVLLQRSEGGALGIGGGGGGLMTARGAANALTRTTAILAAGFFITSLALGLSARYGNQPTDILDRIPANQSAPSGTGNNNGTLLDQLGGMPATGSAPTGTTQTPAGKPVTADPAIAPSNATTTGPLNAPAGDAAPAAPVTPAPAGQTPAP